MTPGSAAVAIADLFDDQGASILAEAGVGSGWEALLGTLPPAVFDVRSENPALTVLTLARDLWSRSDQLRLAIAATRGLLAWQVKAHGHEHPDTLMELGALGALAGRAGRSDEGAELLERAWNGLRSVVGGRDLRLAVVGGNWGLHLARVGRLEEGEHVLEQAFKVRQRIAPNTLANVAGQLGEIRMRLGRIDEGLDALRAAWMAELDQHGEQAPATLRRALTLAVALNRGRKHREAATLWRDMHKVALASGNAERIAQTAYELGVALYGSHRQDEGIRKIEEAIRYTRSAPQNDGRPHPELADRLTFHAQIQVDARRPFEAEGLLREAVDVERRLSGDDSVPTARRQATLGTLCARIGRLDEGLGYLESAASLLRSSLGDDNPIVVAAVEGVVELLLRKVEEVMTVRDKATATELMAHANGVGGPVLGFDHPLLMAVRKAVTEHKLRM